MIRRVRICIWRGGFFLFWVHAFLGAVFFVSYSLGRFLRAVFFGSFSSFLRLVFFLRLCFFLFLRPVFFISFSSSTSTYRFIRPSWFLPSWSSRLANVILLVGHFRLPLSIDEPVCLPL
jgi:hypothetical protein